MCLYVTPGQKPVVAERDIIAYKLLKWNPKKCRWETPYQAKAVGRIATGKTLVPDEQYFHVFSNGTVEGGVIHCYTDLEVAIDDSSWGTEFLSSKNRTLYDGCRLFRVTIPKGTRYLLGEAQLGAAKIKIEEKLSRRQIKELSGRSVGFDWFTYLVR